METPSVIQALVVVGGIIVCALYIAVIKFSTGCEGDCAQGRKPCNCKGSQSHE